MQCVEFPEGNFLNMSLQQRLTYYFVKYPLENEETTEAPARFVTKRSLSQSLNRGEEQILEELLEELSFSLRR